MKNRVFISLDVESMEIPPDQLAAMIGLEADRSWRVGDKRGKTQIRETTNGWSVSSGLDERASLDDHMVALLDRLQPVAERIAQLQGKAASEICCAIYADDPPVLAFSPTVVQQMANLKAGLDIDLYITGDERSRITSSHSTKLI